MEDTSPKQVAENAHSSGALEQYVPGGAPTYGVTHPFVDTPGTGQNEGLNAAMCATWGFLLLIVALFFGIFASLEMWESSEGGAAPRTFIFLSAACMLAGLVLLAIAFVRLGHALSNIQALLVAVVRNHNLLEGFDVEGMSLRSVRIVNDSTSATQAPNSDGGTTDGREADSCEADGPSDRSPDASGGNPVL